jgi:hypothetical protein
LVRGVVFTIAVVFIAGFALLTAQDLSRHGLTAAGVLALIVLVLFTVGILGAILKPRRR